MFTDPKSVRDLSYDCWVRVRMDKITELRDSLGGVQARNEVMRWVSPEFQACADEIYLTMRSPHITLLNVWQIFSEMAALLPNI